MPWNWSFLFLFIEVKCHIVSVLALLLPLILLLLCAQIQRSFCEACFIIKFIVNLHLIQSENTHTSTHLHSNKYRKLAQNAAPSPTFSNGSSKRVKNQCLGVWKFTSSGLILHCEATTGLFYLLVSRFFFTEMKWNRTPQLISKKALLPPLPASLLFFSLHFLGVS